VQEFAAGLPVSDAAGVRAAIYAELIIVQCVTVRCGVMITAAVRAGAMGIAGAAMRAAVRAALNLLARVAPRGGAFEMAALCVEALTPAASAM